FQGRARLCLRQPNSQALLAELAPIAVAVCLLSELVSRCRQECPFQCKADRCPLLRPALPVAIAQASLRLGTAAARPNLPEARGVNRASESVSRQLAEAGCAAGRPAPAALTGAAWAAGD